MGWFGKKKEQDPLNLKDTKPKSTLTDSQKELLQKMGAKKRAKLEKKIVEQRIEDEQQETKELQIKIKLREGVLKKRREEDIKTGWRPRDEGDEEED